MNQGQLYGRELGSKCADAIRYRKRAENSEDTCETADGPDSWNPPAIFSSVERFVPHRLSSKPTRLSIRKRPFPVKASTEVRHNLANSPLGV
jgi:hypothetical protein